MSHSITFPVNLFIPNPIGVGERAHFTPVRSLQERRETLLCRIWMWCVVFSHVLDKWLVRDRVTEISRKRKTRRQGGTGFCISHGRHHCEREYRLV